MDVNVLTYVVEEEVQGEHKDTVRQEMRMKQDIPALQDAS